MPINWNHTTGGNVSTKQKLVMNLVRGHAVARAFEGTNTQGLAAIRKLSKYHWQASEKEMYNLMRKKQANAELKRVIEKDGPLGMVRECLRQGADPNHLMSTSGMTVLMCAASKGRPDIVKLLISSGANVNAMDIHGVTPLKAAARRGDIESMKLLIRSGAKVNATVPRGLSLSSVPRPILYYAIDGGDEGVPFLLRHGADPYDIPQYHKPVLGTAVFLRRMESSKALIRAMKPRIAQYGLGPLFLALENGDLEITTMLLDAGVDINGKDPDNWIRRHETPLSMAVFNGNVPLIRLLIQRGANTNIRYPDGQSLFEGILKSAHSTYATIRVLIQDGGAKVSNGRNAVSFVERIFRNDLPELNTDVRFILSTVNNLNIPSTNGVTPLQMAVHRKNPALVQMLLDLGATYNAKTRVDTTNANVKKVLDRHLRLTAAAAGGKKRSTPTARAGGAKRMKR